MPSHRVIAGLLAAVAASLLYGCGSGTPFGGVVGAIEFETLAVPAGGAGQFYDAVISFRTTGGVNPPDSFEVRNGTLPPGLALRAETNGSGEPTGRARLRGFPRQSGTYSFEIRATSTSQTPAIAVTRPFTITIGEGSIAILTPTATEGSNDVAVPAFPNTVDFVNPANPQAFFSFAFQVAGGSGDNELNVYMPRELELSVFDQLAKLGGTTVLRNDTDESASSGDRFEPAFADGGWFWLQAGDAKVQVGGFQSPRGPVGTLTEHGPVASPSPGLDPAWFQRPAASGGPPANSRRDFADTLGLAGGDSILVPGRTIRFSDYFDAAYEGTHPGFTDPDPLTPPALTRRKYPFPASEYANAFFLDFNPATDLTPLRYLLIVEAIDRRSTPAKTDDVIARKAFVVQVRIPDISIDSVFLPDGQAGVDYTEFVAASGGVPPLRFELEWVDGTADFAATTGDPLTKPLFGVELNADTGRFFGVPRASAGGADRVELTVRVFADVMNPVQNGDAFVPGASPGEGSGRHPVTGKRGAHRTYPVRFAPPTVPTITNAQLAQGQDGIAYGGDRLDAVGGVPRLLPEPVGFSGTYPTGTARRNYAYESSFPLDASHGASEGSLAPGLPNALVLDGDPDSVNNGLISGTPFDRGFHPVRFTLRDFYVGASSAPDPVANRQVVTRTLVLGVAPDTALYVRGVQSSESGGGIKEGLESPSTQQALLRNVPIALAAGLFQLETGKLPALYDPLPRAFDILPVMLPHGGDDEHLDKSIPSVSGQWPAESNKETVWLTSGYAAWQHCQQEFTWIQTPGPQHRRVFLWGETLIKQFDPNVTTGQNSTRYQEFETLGRRGVLVVDPRTGDFWVPAILSNNDVEHGTQFGAEVVLSRGDEATDHNQEGTGYWKFHGNTGSAFNGGASSTRADRELLVTGLGCYIETFSSTSASGWSRVSMGRSAISVAMSADGLWAATALPGGDGPKFLLWRTDKQPIPTAIRSRVFVTSLAGKDASGATLANSACIVNLHDSGNASGVDLTGTDSRILLPDSLCFVQDGLLFLLEGRLDRVFGMSLVDGHLSSVLVPGSDPATGMYIPDQDYLRGAVAQVNFSAQFAFAGNRPPAGEEGSDKLAFVAGLNSVTDVLTDLPARSRDGYVQKGNRDKNVFFLELAKNATIGLDLGAANATLRNLTSGLTGDFLTPGRIGEEQDWLAVSPDGKYVAVVRDQNSNTDFNYTTTRIARMTFATVNETLTTSAQVNDDLLLIATDPNEDLDTGTSGVQNVLYVGSGAFSAGTTTNPPGMPANATGRPHLNATFRRVNGLVFGKNTGAGERSLIFNYSGDDARHPKFNGRTASWGLNPTSTGTFSFGVQSSIRMQFKSDAGASINMNVPSSIYANNLQGLTGINAIGPTAAPFQSTATSSQMFWSTFRSQNGSFLYFVSDQIDGRNFIVGLNITPATINGRAPYAPFSPHPSTVGLEQIEVNSFNYEDRFFAVPAGVTNPTSGRDGGGLVFFVASASSAGATSATDLEVYVFDANAGGDAVVLTPNVTTGTANAINHLYVSTDGNVLAGHRSRTTLLSRDNRGPLNGNSDLFVVTNVHAALNGSPPDDFVVSSALSHGSTVGFVGDGTVAGPQAIVFSAGPVAADNLTWDDRTLRLAPLRPGAPVTTIDSTLSHYGVLSASRKLADNPNTQD